MATLKDISMRLKSVKNIQKITKSMKMVSAAKFAKAEKALKGARPYGQGATEFYDKAEVGKKDDGTPRGGHLLIAVTSDRGLCGAANSSIVRAIRAHLKAHPEEMATSKIVAIGDKSRAMFQRQYADNMLMHFSNVGKKPASFEDASLISNSITTSGFEFEKASMFYNTFRSVVSYDTTLQPLYSLEIVAASEKLPIYDSVDEDLLRSYNEFTLTSLIFFAMKEAACSEQSARMTAMEGATKNAGEMIDKLTLLFNRTRQAAITRELTEIISGAAAV